MILITCVWLQFQVRVDMGEPILKASDVPTKLPANKDQSVVRSKLDVDGITWNVTCVSMGNPHCVTFATEASQVFYLLKTVLRFNCSVKFLCDID